MCLMITNSFEHKGITTKVRPMTSDSVVVEEVMGGTYRKLNIQHDDVVLDIGMNIGIFTIWALRQGAKFVYGYEPDPNNYSLAQYNIKKNSCDSKSKQFNKAVIGTDDKQRYFAINLKRNKGAHSLVPKRGRNKITVDCVNINEILKLNPTIIKMDIEGGEYECLKAVKSFIGIKQLILEFHHAHLNDMKTHFLYNDLLATLRKNFKTVEARDSNVIGGAWTGLIYCTQG